MSGILYVVATPIGNLEDITLRALRILKEVDLIAAEDTRHTRKLLSRYGISTPLTSYYDRIERSKAPILVEKLQQGKTIALVTDAGTPGISDPGYRLVWGAQEAGITVIPIPGPSALTAILSCAGLPTHRFAFEGFLPARRSQRLKALERLKGDERSFIFYESPGRVKEMLEDLRTVFGDRRVVVGRELTKVFEEILRGKISDVLRELAGRKAQGELTIVVQGGSEEEEEKFPQGLADEIRALQKKGLGLKDIAIRLAREKGVPRRTVYQEGLRLRKEASTQE